MQQVARYFVRLTTLSLLAAGISCGRGDCSSEPLRAQPGPSNQVPGGTRADSIGLVEAAEQAYHAESRAMSAYAREECQECPEVTASFVAGSRYAFEQAVRLHPRDARALTGLARLVLSTGFEGDGNPIDSVVFVAESLAVRARAGANNLDERAAADSLLDVIHRIQSASPE